MVRSMEKNRANKRRLSHMYVLAFCAIIITVSLIVGRNVSYAYNEKNNTNYNLFQIIRVEMSGSPVKHILKEGHQTINQLCGRSTGVCNQVVGTVTLDGVELPLFIYSDFDRFDEEATTYFRLGKKKITPFVYLEYFSVFDGKYLVVTEPNSNNDKYLIRIYNHNASELMNYEATDLNSPYEIDGKSLTFHYCDINDTTAQNGQTLHKVIRYQVLSDNVTEKKEISSEYRKCI